MQLLMGTIPLHRAYTLVNKAKAVERLNKLLVHAGKYGKNPGIFKISISNLANPATYTAILAKYNKAASKELFTQIYGELMRARTWVTHESKALTDSMFDTVNKYNLGRSDFVRTGMYGAIFSTQRHHTDPEYWTEVEFNAARVVQNSENKLKAFEEDVIHGDNDGKSIRDELKIAKELYTAISKRRTMDETNVPMAGLLSKGQQELYRKLRAFAIFHEADMERNTKGVWDGDFTKQYNYFPTFALGNVRTGNPKQGDEFIPSDKVNNMWEALHKNKQFGQVIARQSGFSKEKLQPSNYYYDYDIMSIAHKFAPSILFDLYAARELKILNQLLNGNSNNPVKSNGKNVDDVFSRKVLEGLNRQIKSVVGGVVMYEEGLTRAYKFIQTAKNHYATALLGTIGQFLVQTSSAPAAAIAMSPKGFPRALAVVTGIERGQTHSALKEALDKLAEKGATITVRDVLFEKWQTIEDVQKQGLRRATSRWAGTAEKITTAALRNGDKFAARLVWFSEFFAVGGDINNPSEEHIMAAERAVGILQNMSDVAFSAPLLRTNSQAGRILAAMLYAFQQFALNNALNVIYATKYSLTTKNAEARQVAVAGILMAAAYNAVNTYVVRPAYSAAASALFGSDDDDDDEKNFSKHDEFLWGTAWDLLVSQWAPAPVESLIKYFGIKPIMEKRAEENGEAFDMYKDVPLYMPRSESDVYGESAGLYGDVSASAITLFSGMIHSAMESLEGDEELDMDVMTVQMIRSGLMFNRLIPFRGDLQKLLRNYERSLKKEARNTGGSAPTGIETGTEFEVPEFTTPDYTFEFPEDPTQIVE